MIVSLNTETLVEKGSYVCHLTEGWETTELSFAKNYQVYAMGVELGILRFLIDPLDDLRPVWYTADTFMIMDGYFSEAWEPAYGTSGRTWSLIIGYELLGHSTEHFDGILERDPNSISEFAKYKTLIDGEQS